jgi:hypothetical protein
MELLHSSSFFHFAFAFCIFILTTPFDMTISCLAFIGKSNEPMFVYTDSDDSESLQLHSIVHCALDILEERKGKKTSNTTTSPTYMFLGQLYAVEDFRV